MSIFKRILCGCLTFAVVVSGIGVLNASAEEAQLCIVGDTDGNGVVDISDATLLQMHIADGSGLILQRDDTNRDGSVDISDATYIQMYVAELFDETTPIGKPAEEAPAAETTDPESPYSLNADRLTLGVGEKFLLETDSSSLIAPAFASDSPETASVDESGLITANAVGTAAVTCDIGGQTRTCEVEVCPFAKTLRLNKESLTLGVGEVYDLNSYVEEGSAAYFRAYSSDNEKIASVTEEGGYVTANSVGKAKIICALSDGVKAVCEVTVKPMATSLSLNKNVITVETGNSFDFNSTVPSDTAAYFRDYYSEDESVVQIEKSGGLMTAVGEGSTRVYCELGNGTRAYAEVTVTPRSLVRAAMIDYLHKQLGKNNRSYIKYINSHSSFKTDNYTAWCAIFAWCCLDVFADQNGYKNNIKPQIYVSDIADEAKKQGALRNYADTGYIPKPGDLFLTAYKKHPINGERCHIGYVEYVETDKNGKLTAIHTIEGNYNWENESPYNTKVTRGVWKPNKYDAYGAIVSEFIDLAALYPDRPAEPLPEPVEEPTEPPIQPTSQTATEPFSTEPPTTEAVQPTENRS